MYHYSQISDTTLIPFALENVIFNDQKLFEDGMSVMFDRFLSI